MAYGLVRELGKRYVVIAVFQLHTDVYTGAVLFNISPDNVLQFQDKMKKFVDNLTKLSKILAPSVLFLNNAHFPFIKKVFPFTYNRINLANFDDCKLGDS